MFGLSVRATSVTGLEAVADVRAGTRLRLRAGPKVGLFPNVP